jgi:Xaa-Pro dipeptidase
VFEEWEADFGRTYVLGADPEKHRLVDDIGSAFAQGKELFERTPQLSCGELYDFVHDLAPLMGWEFGGPTAGHLIGHFPHEQPPADPQRFKIRHGNGTMLREPDAAGAMRHWILEIHFIDRARGIGGFFEELLTV